jgi:uncharacterized membrane protein
MPDSGSHHRVQSTNGHTFEPLARSEDPSLARLGAFSDGVFAFAVTLLILAIRIPHPDDADAGRGLLTLLSDEWRSYLAYIVSFMLVGINWANHRVMFATFVRSSHVLVWLNLLYLMIGVAFAPIPTAVLGGWLGSSRFDDQVAAAVFYGLYATAGALVYNVMWWYAAYGARLTYPTMSPLEVRAHTLAWAPAPLLTGALTLLALASPAASVAGYLAVILLYVLPMPRLMAIGKRRLDRSR